MWGLPHGGAACSRALPCAQGSYESVAVIHGESALYRGFMAINA